MGTALVKKQFQMKFFMTAAFLIVLVLSVSGWNWTKPKHSYDKNCPDSIWRDYFKFGKYEAAWWGHRVSLHPDYIQAEHPGLFLQDLRLGFHCGNLECKF